MAEATIKVTQTKDGKWKWVARIGSLEGTGGGHAPRLRLGKTPKHL